MLRYSLHMNRRQLLLTLGLGALATTATLARRQSDTRPPRIITTKDSTYLIGKIEPVLPGKIREIAPASKGRYVLAIQDLRPEPTDDMRQPFGEEKLWLYDSLRRTARLVERLQDDSVTQIHRGFTQLLWFAGTKRALVVRGEGRLTEAAPEAKGQLGIFEVERGTIRWLSGLPTQPVLAQEVTGLEGILLTWEREGVAKPNLYSVLEPDGSASPIGKLPYERFSPQVQGISTDGKRLFLRTFKVQDQGIRADAWTALELSTGILTLLKEAPKDLLVLRPDTKPQKPALMLQNDPSRLTGAAGRSADTRALWLEATDPATPKKFTRALVAAEASPGEAHLLPDLSAVLYTHDDALYAAPIATLDRVAFEKLLRQLAMTNAMQTGLGLMMYAQDYDSNFPHDPASVKEAIFPYIKNADTLADFVFTYTGPTGLNQIGQPSTTPLGYIPSPGGRAVVYGDGHVKWEPDPIK